MEIKIPKVYMGHFRVHGDFVCYNLLIFPTGTKRRGLSSSHSDLGVEEWRGYTDAKTSHHRMHRSLKVTPKSTG